MIQSIVFFSVADSSSSTLILILRSDGCYSSSSYRSRVQFLQAVMNLGNTFPESLRNLVNPHRQIWRENVVS